MCENEPFGIMRKEQAVEKSLPKSFMTFGENLLETALRCI